MSKMFPRANSWHSFFAINISNNVLSLFALTASSFFNFTIQSCFRYNSSVVLQTLSALNAGNNERDNKEESLLTRHGNTLPLQSTMASKSSSSFDELRWVVRIRRTLDEELEDDDGIPVSIFKVPKSLMAPAPDSYTPQLVALGPYHSWRPELREMERFKLSAAKKAKKCSPGNLQFHDLVEQLMKLEQLIRASYQNYLDFSGETLAWMMAIDASFLLEFLRFCAVKQGRLKILARVFSRISHLADYAGTKPAHNAVLRDIVMLENQIPLFVLRNMMEFQSESSELADEILLSMLMGLCRELSPFNLMADTPTMEITDCTHLLDFLHQMITPKLKQPSEIIEIADQIEVSSENSSCPRKCAHRIKNLVAKSIEGSVCFMKRSIQSKPVKIILRLPWAILSNVPGFAIFKQPVEYLFFTQNRDETKEIEIQNDSSNHNINRPPLVEEITIPSVTELAAAGVRFEPSNGGISTISFDSKSATLYLPTARIDENTEILMRNLVAYEASSASGPLVFTRYTELMNGIVDSEEDVKFLREGGIILNHLKSDGEAAILWNGMSKSIRLTRVSFLDKAIEDVNKYYNGLWRVKLARIVRGYLYSSWPLLALMAAVWLLAMIALQAFCSVFGCVRIFHHRRT